jgi:hypothetical protein
LYPTEEVLSVRLIFRSSALIVLVVSESGLGVGSRAVKVVTPSGSIGVLPCTQEIHHGDVVARFASTVAVAGHFFILCVLFVMLAGVVESTEL